MMERATFSKGHAVFQVGKLNWTPLPFEARRSPNIPAKRYLHSAVAAAGKLYLMGGIDNDSDNNDQRMYCLDLHSMKWTIIDGKNYCEGRNGHACALFRNEIYFFGGSLQHSNPTRDFFKFTPAEGTWTLLESEESVPSERELAVMGCLNDQFLFLLGGIDIPEDKILHDAFVYRTGKWARLNISNAPSERIRMGLAVNERRAFLFGGEGPAEPSPILFDNLFELDIDEFNLELSFRELSPRGRKPRGRTAHGFVAVSPRFLLLYGGEAGEDGVSEVMGDIWVMDLEEMAWTEIETLYGSMTPRYEFTMVVHRNEIFIFGGMNEEHAVVDNLAKLEFLEQRETPREPCEACQRHLAARSAPKVLSPLLSTGFYYNLALEITFPFRAVEIITEVAERLGAPTIKINSAKTLEDFDFLSFEFEATRGISAECFLHLPESNENAEEAELVHLLKLGALRLGKTFLYVEASAGERRVMLMSANSRFAADFEDTPMHYAYVESLSTGECFHGASYGDKQAVANVLRSQVGDPFPVLARGSGSLLLIFQLNILPTVEKAYYYELIFYSHPEADIKIYHNEKKTELLETLGYDTNSLPDFSCRAYLRYSKLARAIVPCISNDDPVPTHSYLSYLMAQRGLRGLRELAMGRFASPLVEQCAVFECGEEWLENNQGVLVYCGNQLIDRYDCELGHLVSDKFYKKKYRKRHNLFRYTGVLLISPALRLNLTATRPTHRLAYQQIMEELVSKIKAARSGENHQEEMSNLLSRFFYNRDSTKRIKRDANPA